MSAPEEKLDEDGNVTLEGGELTEQDLLDMKTLSVEGSQSVVSLADSASNFEEHVADEDVVQMDDVDDVGSVDEMSDAASSLVPPLSQARIIGGYMFERIRSDNFGDLPETVTVLSWPRAPIELSLPPNYPPEETDDLMEAVQQAKVFLVGTAHFSKKSQEDVRKTVTWMQPDVVMVELCPSRISILSLDEETLFREAKDMSTAKIIQLMRNGSAMSGVMYVLLISMSATVTRQLGMAPGGEFREAYKSAQKVPLCQFALGDRPIEVTLGRALAKLSIFQKIRFFWHLIMSHKMKITEEEVERCKEAGNLEELMKEMAGDFPGLTQILVDERDRYMTYVLQSLLINHSVKKRLAWQHTDGIKWQPLRVVAVVGIGHKPGIVSYWDEVQELKDLMHVPPPTLSQRLVTASLKYGTYALIAFASYRVARAVFRRVR